MLKDSWCHAYDKETPTYPIFEQFPTEELSDNIPQCPPEISLFHGLFFIILLTKQNWALFMHQVLNFKDTEKVPAASQERLALRLVESWLFNIATTRRLRGGSAKGCSAHILQTLGP